MGISLSSVALRTFEFANEIFIAVGAGFFGLGILIENAFKTNNYFNTIFITTITISSFYYALQNSYIHSVSNNMVIFITGCDSGLGFSLAQHACEMNFTVLAGCLNLNSNGAKELRRLFGTNIHLIEINVTKSQSVRAALEVVEKFIKTDPNYKLWAIVNNAAVMVFGEFEWQTEKLIKNQLEVNLMGTFRVTKAFCPLLRHHKGRVVVISSHCAQATLPGLSIYGATKYGLKGWCDGLRVELGKYGIKVVSFIPGSFAQQSNIMARQVEDAYEMHSSMTEEQSLFYGDYFRRYNSYLSVIAGEKVVEKIDDPHMYEIFEHVILDENPSAVYKNENCRYKFYHFIFKYSPTIIRDFFITKFMVMPQYEERPSTRFKALS